MIAITALGSSPGRTDSGANVEDSGSTTPGSGKEADAVRPPLGNGATRASTMNPLDLQFPLLPPPTTDSDGAIGGRSPRESKAEHMGDHPPDRSRYSYDIV
jgi:hypothetical protein